MDNTQQYANKNLVKEDKNTRNEKVSEKNSRRDTRAERTEESSATGGSFVDGFRDEIFSMIKDVENKAVALFNDLKNEKPLYLIGGLVAAGVAMSLLKGSPKKSVEEDTNIH